MRRNYYRCSHLKEKKCQAKKTVQQKEGSGERIRFVVTYKMHHTCKSMDPTYPLLVESATREDSVISFAAEDNPPRKKMEASSTVPMLIDLNLTVQS
ncbi:hypothetical protein KSP40_PGU020197 [Platanthera guangdongensis]|uniref:WRKY domain-containing protein n=1 Tax=Platanthera guangdongensis TaxID=2320717 RepID=A0ABR2LTY3_9ASPA